MNSSILASVPPGLCRKFHLLAPGGKLGDVSAISRDDLPTASISPTSMEVLEGFGTWDDLRLSPELGLMVWFFESEQLDGGGFRRDPTAMQASIGTAIRFLQICGTVGLSTESARVVEKASNWLRAAVTSSGAVLIPSGAEEVGTTARAMLALSLIGLGPSSCDETDRARRFLIDSQLDECVWPTYPSGRESTGATALALRALTLTAHASPGFLPRPDWLLDVQSVDGGWGEHDGSGSKIDNTFWVARTLSTIGMPDSAVAIQRSCQWMGTQQPTSDYDIGMAIRFRTLMGCSTDADQRAVSRSLCASLDARADKYAVTCLHGLSSAERLVVDRSTNQAVHRDRSLPLRTPRFIRSEPAAYDRLSGLSGRAAWLSIVDWASETRALETLIGLFAGTILGIALFSGEVAVTIDDLHDATLAGLLFVEICIALSWLILRGSRQSIWAKLAHLGISFTIGIPTSIRVRDAIDLSAGVLPLAVSAVLVSLTIDISAILADRASILGRLADD